MSKNISGKVENITVKLKLTPEQASYIDIAIKNYTFAYNYRKCERDAFYERTIKGRQLTKEQYSQEFKNFHPKKAKVLYRQYPWLKDTHIAVVKSAFTTYDIDLDNKIKSYIKNGRKGVFKTPEFKADPASRCKVVIHSIPKSCLDYKRRTATFPGMEEKMKFVSPKLTKYGEDKWYETAIPHTMTIKKNTSLEYWCTFSFIRPIEKKEE